MTWKKLGKALLFPHIAVIIILLPLSVGLMLYGMIALGEAHVLTIAFCALAFYATMVTCIRIPSIVRYWKGFRHRNKYADRWLSDTRLRVSVTLGANVLWNGAYAALQLGLGLYHRSLWFCSLAAYYTCISVMRLFLLCHTLRHAPGTQMRRELRHYRACGWIFLLLNLALSGMILYMVRQGRTVAHNEITTIAIAAYTFTSLTMAIINLVRYRKYNSPVFSASKAISLAAACVSMLTLENTMLATFSGGELSARTLTLYLGLSGAAVAAWIVAMAVYMIVRAGRQIKSEEFSNGK